ncbi:MAG TPA: ATP-dependent protease [Clostridiales bacterium]|nr:ATP-dependent protease [Clostridiales bacterium]
MTGTNPLRPEALRLTVDPSVFPFRTTEELPPVEGRIGQERAVEAMEFGLRITSPGFNIFMAGASGTGKSTYARQLVAEVALGQPAPDDWCYVHNFEEADHPLILRLPPGRATVFARDLEQLVNDLKDSIPRAFDSEDYERQRNEIVKTVHERQQQAFAELERAAGERGFALKSTSTGFVTAPVVGGQMVSPEDYENLDDASKRLIDARRQQLQEVMADTIRRVRGVERAAREQLAQLESGVALFAAKPLLDELRGDYRDFPAVLRYLDQIQEDVVQNLSDFRQTEDKPAAVNLLGARVGGVPDLSRYRVNVIVANGGTDGAPVVFETNPTYYNLFGSMEYRGEFGMMTTDFTMVKGGSLHRANGGYLILQVVDMFTDATAWLALKRALKTGEVRIENIGQQFRLVPTATLKPEPMPLQVKVVMIGSPMHYLLLQHYDEDFRKLFKIKADFDVETDSSPGRIAQYAAFVGSVCRQGNLRHFDREAVARVIEFSCRLAEDQNKLSTRFNDISELIYEASTVATLDGAVNVGARHVDAALREKIDRSNRLEERVQEFIARGVILVDTEGEVIGQVNGVAVLDLGDHRFGKPSRITATAGLGRAGIVNIDRESRLSGRIHSKGVLTLGGYLLGKFARRQPLALSATLGFEQLYDEVEGDSASGAELCCLLSAIGQIPLRQGLAMTGSVNQRGEIQPVGGVNEKIEGFFQVCKARGFRGDQGVIIPSRNVANLMLREELVDAVRAGQFQVYAVDTIGQAMETLSGVRFGEEDPGGAFEPGTVCHQVETGFRDLAERMARFGRELAGPSDSELRSAAPSPAKPPGEPGLPPGPEDGDRPPEKPPASTR